MGGRHRKPDELDEPTGELAVIAEPAAFVPADESAGVVGCGCGCGSCDGGEHCHNDVAGCAF